MRIPQHAIGHTTVYDGKPYQIEHYIGGCCYTIGTPKDFVDMVPLRLWEATYTDRWKILVWAHEAQDAIATAQHLTWRLPVSIELTWTPTDKEQLQ